MGVSESLLFKQILESDVGQNHNKLKIGEGDSHFQNKQSDEKKFLMVLKEKMP